MEPPPPPPPAELINDAISEILLRLPPDEPQCLFRASLVSKPWRRLLTDAAFLRRYRRFHPTPPLLGIFSVVSRRGAVPISRFIPTTSPSPFPNPMLNCGSWVAFDCHHGRVLLQKLQLHERKLIVWDPITGDRKEVDEPLIPYEGFSVAVLCAAPGCDHGDCHGGPFLIVWVCNDNESMELEGTAHACVYSSQTGSWGTLVSVPIGANDFVDLSRGALAGDDVYFMLQTDASPRILKYDLVKHRLSVIDPPESYKNGIFIVPTEDGLLGAAGIKGTRLYLWSRKVNAEGVEGWMQYRVIKLQNLLPDDNEIHEAAVIAFAENVRVIFMSTSRGIAMIDLNTEKARTVGKPEKYYPTVPFTSFYTPDCACGKLPLPAETN